jgi:hypothetical protein
MIKKYLKKIMTTKQALKKIFKGILYTEEEEEDNCNQENTKKK